MYKFTGSKYDTNLTVTDICKLIRKDLKEALGKNWKFSVRKRHYNAISIEILDCPPQHIYDMFDHNAYQAHKNAGGFEWKRTEFHRANMQIISDIVNAYNFDDSDGQTDYFHVNFYEDVRFSHDLKEMAIQFTENNYELREANDPTAYNQPASINERIIIEEPTSNDPVINQDGTAIMKIAV